MTETYRIRHGGLMRCCLESLDAEMVKAVDTPQEGDKVRCLYCKDDYGMRFYCGAWEWAKPLEPER